MIGQYLSNKNESATVAKSKIFYLAWWAGGVASSDGKPFEWINLFPKKMFVFLMFSEQGPYMAGGGKKKAPQLQLTQHTSEVDMCWKCTWPQYWSG